MQAQNQSFKPHISNITCIMSKSIKLLRSVLFTPADLKKSFVKVIQGPVDCIVFDLEVRDDLLCTGTFIISII